MTKLEKTYKTKNKKSLWTINTIIDIQRKDFQVLEVSQPTLNSQSQNYTEIDRQVKNNIAATSGETIQPNIEGKKFHEKNLNHVMKVMRKKDIHPREILMNCDLKQFPPTYQQNKQWKRSQTNGNLQDTSCNLLETD